MGVTDGFILGVDLDGVCGDYTAALREVVAEPVECGREAVDVRGDPADRAGWVLPRHHQDAHGRTIEDRAGERR